MMSFRIGDRDVGANAPVLVVAELSANHGGKLETALATIEMAAKCGADAIKIQTYTPDTLTLNSSAEPFVVHTANEWAGRTLHHLYAEAMTPWEWHAALRDCARANGLTFFSTPFDATAVDFLEALGVPAHKIASFELVDLPLIERAARTGKPIIMSTGMASLGEVEAAVKVCLSAGNDQLALLRCVSAYPARPETMDLASMEVLKSFGTVIGLSDHTRDSTAAVSAVALGARILEKHFILRRDVGGPDAFFSVEPEEFAATVRAVRAAQSAVGRPRFGPSSDERPSLGFRRSIFVARDVVAGRSIDCDDVRSVRPSGGLPAKHLPQVLGRVAHRDLVAGSPLEWDMLGARVTSDITLRRATSGDAATLLRWRNDPLTCSMSVTHDVVTPEQHALWLAASIASKDRHLFIADGKGQVRLDAHGSGSFEVSITVDPEARGRGVAVKLLLSAEEEAKKIGVSHISAWIRVENVASIRTFKRAGYYGFAPRTRDGQPFLFCERRIEPYE